MAVVDSKIVDFIGKHHVMTLATMGCGEVYCSNLFYSYMKEENLFVFTTDCGTRHGSEMLADGNVAASVVLETRSVGKVQGLQIQGVAGLARGDALKSARRSYLAQFPYAVVAELTLWTLRPVFMKLTDNRLGFGKKLVWDER